MKAEGKQAGTHHAWWRPGFEDAMSALETIARGETPDSANKTAHFSSLLSFHDPNEDGLI